MGRKPLYSTVNKRMRRRTVIAGVLVLQNPQRFYSAVRVDEPSLMEEFIICGGWNLGARGDLDLVAALRVTSPGSGGTTRI